MNKVKIKVVSIGHMPLSFNQKKVEKWKSNLFQLDGAIENFALRCDSDGYEWEFSDALVKQQLPISNADFMIAIVNVPIEDNWYSRRLGDNQIVFTYHQIREYMEYNNVPLENVIYRILYAYTLVYLRSNRAIPDFSSVSGFTHDETRGCLFDMNGIKTDLIASCDNPQVCNECEERLKTNKVSESVIATAKKEIKKIRKDLYYRILGQIKKHPIWAIFISSIFALSLGIAGSIIGGYVYDYLKTLPAQGSVEKSIDIPVSTTK